MPYLALGPVSEALVTRLNVPALLALAPGGVTDDPQQGVAFPFVWFEVFGGENRGGLGTQPGTGARQEIELRLHAFSRSDQSITWAQPQGVMAMVLALLFAAPLAVTGYVADHWQPDHPTVPLQQVEVQGVQVKELVTMLRFWVTETPGVLLAAAAPVAIVRGGRPA